MTETPENTDVAFEAEMFTQTVPAHQRLVLGSDPGGRGGFVWKNCYGSGKQPGDIFVSGARVLAICLGHCGRSIVWRDFGWVVEPVAIDPEA